MHGTVKIIFWIVLFLAILAGIFALAYFIFPAKELNEAIFTASVLNSQDFSKEESMQESEEPAESEVLPEYEIAPEPIAAVSRQDLLDDIKEKLDVIFEQAQELKNQQNEQNNNNNDDNNIDLPGRIDEYPVVLISEVQVSGVEDEKQEFVELYNPNNFNIDLTGWYLQRKTAGSQSWSSYAESKLFEHKIIGAGGYFLLARAGYYNFADIFIDDSITSNNSFALKNPNGEIVDKLGFGNSQDPEILPARNPEPGRTIGRKPLADWTEEETNDNSFDFELQAPTPKNRNFSLAQSPALDGGGGGGVENPVFLKILISEVQVAGKDDEKQEFVELYNPNNSDVGLTNWYLQRKTSGSPNWSTYASKNLFSGKKIPTGGYFLISRDGYYTESADIFIDSAITDDNSFALKNPNGEISDELGFGNALDFELLSATSPSAGQSVGRKFLDSVTEQDTDDNFSDFELQTPTPKAQNITYVAPIEDPVEPPVEPPVEEIDTTPPSIISYDISDIIISPNGDGIKDSTDIDLEFSEKVKANVNILNSSGDVVVKDFYKSSGVINPHKKTWYGKNSDDDSGEIVPDGVYTINIAITDMAGNSTIDSSKTITVDTIIVP